MSLLLFMNLFSLLDHESLVGRPVSYPEHLASAQNIEGPQSILNESMNEGMKERMDKTMKERMDGWVDG